MTAKSAVLTFTLPLLPASHAGLIRSMLRITGTCTDALQPPYQAPRPLETWALTALFPSRALICG